MSKSKWLIIVVLIGAAILWVAYAGQKDALNKSEAFLFSDTGTIYWFEITSKNGKVEGKLYQQELIEKIGDVPFIEEKEYSVTGKNTEKGYEFLASKDGETKSFDAWFTGTDLAVQKHGESAPLLFQAVSKKEIDEYVNQLQQELEDALYGWEEKEKNRLRTFFSELNSVYGYLYSAEDENYQLFIKIDEALLQGELTGSLLMMVNTGDENNPYEETSYVINGITDGLIIRLFTIVDGEEMKLEGNFIEATVGFNLSFWDSDQKLTLKAVTEDEFQQSYDEFKRKAQNH